MSRFLFPHKKGFKSETDVGKCSLLKQEYTLAREVQANSESESWGGSPDQGHLYLPGAGLGKVPLMRLISFFPGGILIVPLSFLDSSNITIAGDVCWGIPHG